MNELLRQNGHVHVLRSLTVVKIDRSSRTRCSLCVLFLIILAMQFNPCRIRRSRRRCFASVVLEDVPTELVTALQIEVLDAAEYAGDEHSLHHHDEAASWTRGSDGRTGFAQLLST
nr:hypothetical protein CFP56_33619 [Quercus suber]